jgi:hypothetical protein
VKVLVKEKIADTGVDLLRANFDVDLGHDAEPGSGAAGAQRVFAEAGLAPDPVA